MGEYNVKVHTNIPRMILVVVGMGLLVVYLGVFMASRDPYWFVRGFNERPYLIVVYDKGQKVEFKEGQPEFDLMAEAVRQSLDSGIARLSGIGLSEASQEDAYNKYLSLEAHFARPIKLHAWFDTYHPTLLLFPITGRHSNLSVVFLGSGDSFRVNVPALKTVEPIRAALTKIGYSLSEE
jgi:hypothetical protein